MLGHGACDQRLIRLGGGGSEREADFRKPQFEKSVAAARLTVIVPLGRRPGQYLDLSVIQTEAAVDRRDLRLDRALVRQEQPRRTALDNGRCDPTVVDVAKRLGGEDDTGVLLAQGFQPFTELAREGVVIKGQPAFVDDEKRRRTIETIADAVKEVWTCNGFAPVT